MKIKESGAEDGGTLDVGRGEEKQMTLKNRKNNRLRTYDYSRAGYYFITVCVHNRQCLFGGVADGEMVLNEYGKIAEGYWQEIPCHYQNVKLDQWIIMPNHIHGIIIILDNNRNVRTEQCSVPTITDTNNAAKWAKPVSLSQVIKSFKGATTKRIRAESDDLYAIWQRSFYDHVIRNEISLNRIREYIVNNPAKWESDEYYSET